MAKLAGVVRAGGVAIFHEYAHYASFCFAPRRPVLARFVQHVMESWRAAGGEPDVALDLPALLAAKGFVVRSATPRIFCVRPGENAGRWLAGFIAVNLVRLRELGRLDATFIEQARRELAEAEANPSSLMLTHCFWKSSPRKWVEVGEWLGLSRARPRGWKSNTLPQIPSAPKRRAGHAANNSSRRLISTERRWPISCAGID